MSSRRTALFVTLVLASVISGCVTGQYGESDDSESKLLRVVENTEEQVRCANYWANVVAEWEMAGGPLDGSAQSIRARAASGDRTTLSRIMRATWAQQGRAFASREHTTGQWPVPQAEFAQVVAAFGRAVDSEKFAVPELCRSSVYVDLAINSRLSRKRGTDGYEEVRPLEYSGVREWSGAHAPAWWFYWLLVRE